MGKGDKKSRRGKIVNGSYGVKRPRKKYYYEDEVVQEKAAKKS
ncbi:30S ribosomal protein THX [Empedobacter brevis]